LGIIYWINKKTGIKYAYSNEAYWDKEKQQSRAKRKLLGKVDPVTGEIVPTRGYTKRKDAVPDTVVKPGPVPISKVQRSFYGASYLLDQIGKATGVEADLKACFPNSYKQLAIHSLLSYP